MTGEEIRHDLILPPGPPTRIVTDCQGFRRLPYIL
jgi:hypothetical protein